MLRPPKQLRRVSAQEFRLQKDKVRVYALARELNVESKDLLDLCRQAGLDVKNQLSSLDPDQRDMVERLVKQGGGTAVAVAPPPKPSSTIPSSVSTRVPVLPTRPTRREPEAPPPQRPAAPAPAAAEVKAPVAPTPAPVVTQPQAPP